MRPVFVALALLVTTLPSFAQNLAVDRSYYDTLHPILEASNLTHYQLYFQNELIYDWRAPDCVNDTVGTASLMKSITGLAIGELLENGYIRSLDERVCDYLPEWKAGCEQGVTIRHLLTMTSGVLHKPIAERAKFFTASDWNAFSLGLSLDTLPGAKWSYSNEAGQLLEPIIARASGMDAEQFFDTYLFTPLAMPDTRMVQDSAGNYSTIGGAQTRMEDLAHLGLVVLYEGQFQGEQVIDPGYLAEALTPIEQNPYYGYLWWIDTENQTYTAMGDGGTMVIVYPDKELVFVRANNCKTGPDRMQWMGPHYVQAIGRIITATAD